mgnify:CR=1 FL=1
MFMAAVAMMLAATVCAQTEGVNFVEGKTLYEVLQMSKQQGKLAFVDCYTTWCGPCKMMASREFPKKEAGDYFNAKFVNAKFDMEAGEGPEIAKKYQIQAYPTFLILNAEGELVHRVVGAGEIGEFIKRVEAGLTGKSLSDYQKDFEAGERDEAFLREYLNLLESQSDKKQGKVVADALLQNKSAEAIVADSALFKTFIRHEPDVKSELFKGVCQQRDAVKKNYGEQAENSLMALWRSAMQDCFDEKDGTVVEQPGKVNEMKALMQACNFGDKAEEVEKYVREDMAYANMVLASRKGEKAPWLQAMKDFEPILAKEYPTEESVREHYMEDMTYATCLKRLMEKFPNDKEVKKFVKKQAGNRIKLLEKARAVTKEE